MQENMRLFDRMKDTPAEAKKPIQAGRLKGFTDINPMWRFKRLTEVFGPCGIGWKYEITDQRIVSGHGNTVAAFVDILLYYKEGDTWSAGIPGIGGSMFVAQEKGGFHTSDECFKMALTDAIGTACKALGMSADVFYEKDRDKYNAAPDADAPRMETFEDARDYRLTFGRHAGRTIGEVWQSDLEYIKYLRDNDQTEPIIKKAIGIINDGVKGRR